MISEKAKTYLVYWLSAVMVTLCIIGLFNLIVDPYGLYRIVDISGFNQQKEGVRNKIRYVKALELPLCNPKTIILGSSRVHDGINPQHFLLQNPDISPAYNLGIDMLRVKEALAYLKHSLIHSEIKQVIFGLDFFMFNAKQRTNSNYDATLVGREIGKRDYLTTSLFSLGALGDSINTIKYSYSQPGRREFLSNGYRPGNYVFYGVKSYPALHYYTNYTFLSSRPSTTKYYADIELDKQTFDDFEEILKICKERDVRIKLYMSPANAYLDGEGIVAAGKWNMMEDWKRQVVKIADKYAVPLWDFSGYNSITTEKVQTPMSYYWDSSHFTEATSDLMLRRMFLFDDVPNAVPADFGVLVSSKNIEEHLMHIRTLREEHFYKNKENLSLMHDSYKAVLNGAMMDQTKIKDMF